MTTPPRKRVPAKKYAFLWRLMADPALSSSAKCVAATLLLKFHNAKTGQCNPSFPAIGRAMGRTSRAIFPAIAELKDGEWITVESTKGGSSANTNRYKFNFELVKPTSPPPVKPASPVKQNAGGMKHTSHEPLRTTHPSDGWGGEEISPRRAPDGAAEKEEEAEAVEVMAMARSELEAQFRQLCELWRKPQGIDRAKALKAFQTVCADHNGDDVLLSAATWVAKVGPQYLPRLESWLANGGWLNDPPVRRTNSHSKPSAAQVAAALARGEGGGW